MRLRLIAAGTRMPGWVQQGYADFARRLPRECRLELVEIPLGNRRGAAPAQRAVALECERMLAALARDDYVVALDARGRMLDTPGLAAALETWLSQGRDVALLVGGPDGLAPACRQRADLVWSLSALTLPHGLVRLLLAEQLYRAWSLLRGHPYHR